MEPLKYVPLLLVSDSGLPVFFFLFSWVGGRNGWVYCVPVISSINPDWIEMYSDPMAKAGILEPDALAEIKFRSRDIEECALRLDDELRKLTALSGSPNAIDPGRTFLFFTRAFIYGEKNFVL